MTGFIIALIVGLVICITLAILIHNKLNTNYKQINIVEKQLDDLLKKRWHLIPNILNVMMIYIDKSKCLEDVIKLKNRIYDKMHITTKLEVCEELDSKVLELVDANENNKNLNSDQKFKELLKQLQNIDLEIKVVLDSYNEIINKYNNDIEKFPGIFIAKIFKLKRVK